MHSGNDLLIDQLQSINPTMASFVRVIAHAAESLTKAGGRNDFIHSEAVHQRLSSLLPDAQKFGLNEAEIFILIASAYLHDIGHSDTPNAQSHGEIAAQMIITDDSMKYLFPAGDIQNQVAKVCYHHDREIENLRELENDIKLDIRPCYSMKKSEKKVRPRMLGAIFRLADELECNSDRMLGQSLSEDDPRTNIAGVRLDLELRSICLDFKHGATEENRNKCRKHLLLLLKKLDTFLKAYGFSFSIVDKLPERESMDEEEGLDAQMDELDLPEESLTFAVQTHNLSNLDDLMEIGAFPGQCLNLRDHYTTGRNRVNLQY